MHQLALKKPNKPLRLLQARAFFNHTNLFWSWYDPYNFGDWIGPYLYSRITGKSPIHCTPAQSPPCTFFTSAGSIFRKICREDVAIVWGSGIISRHDIFKRPKIIHAVRGPHSMQRCHELGFDCPNVFGDPAILLPEYFTPRSAISYRIGIIPHFVDRAIATEMFRNTPEILIIDVTRPIEVVVEQINSCEATLSSSLHGLIVSHTYGHPSAWVKFSDGLDGDDIKFSDYLSAGGVQACASAIPISKPVSVETLLSIVRDAPLPDNKSLAAALRAACPFPT